MLLKKLTKCVDGKEVSSLMFYVVELPSRKLGVIEEVWTDPEHRGNGYATQLIEEALSFAKIQGLDCVELTVRQDQPHLHEFYQKFGFVDRLNKAFRYSLKELKPWSEQDT